MTKKPTARAATLDLHGYTTDEVEAAIDKFLMQVSNSGANQARLMTGKGTGAVKAVAIKYLKLAGYSWHYERMANGRPNEGCLILHLD